MTRRRISPTLVHEDGSLCCAACGHALGPAGQPWKAHAVLSTVAAATLPGAGSGIHPQVQLRRFACPQCAALLDSELALPGDPFLDDVVAA